jgi:hypothetical protein
MPTPMSADHASNLQTLVKRVTGDAIQAGHEPSIRFSAGPDDPMTDPICDELIWSFLVWEAGEKRAAALAAKLCESFVDFNEFRVCLTGELVSFFGQTYPKAAERADRMRTALNDIFRREHEVSLKSLASMNKRDAKAYLDSIEGIPPYVVNRTFLLGLGGHAFPIDTRLLRLLVNEEAIAESETISSGAGWLERQIRSGDAAPAFVALEVWAADQQGSRKKSSKKVTKKSGSTS